MKRSNLKMKCSTIWVKSQHTVMAIHNYLTVWWIGARLIHMNLYILICMFLYDQFTVLGVDHHDFFFS